MSLSPADYVILQDGTPAMVGNKPEQAGLTEVHAFLGRKPNSKIETRWVDWHTVTKVSPVTWTQILDEKYSK